MEDLETIAGAFPDAPLFANMIEGGVTPFLSYQELQEIGSKTVVYPLSSLFTTANAVARMLGVLRKTGTTAGFDHKVSFEEFEANSGYPEIPRDGVRVRGTLVLVRLRRADVSASQPITPTRIDYRCFKQVLARSKHCNIKSRAR